MSEELAQAFKDGGKLTDEQLSELGSFLEGEGGIKVVVDKFGFSEKDYRRLKQALVRRKIKVPKAPSKPEEELVSVKLLKQKEWVRKTSETMWNIGAETVLRWKTLASQAQGYWNDELKDVDMEKFVTDAIDLYVTKGQEIRGIEMENVALLVSIELLSKMYNELLYRLNEARMAVYMTEMLNQDVESLPLLLTPIKTRLEMG